MTTKKILQMRMEELIAQPLTSEMILKLIPFKVRIYRYSEIKDYQDINELLEPYGCAILLFETNIIDPRTNKGVAVPPQQEVRKTNRGTSEGISRENKRAEAIKKRVISMREFNEGSWIGHWVGLCRTVDEDRNDSINFFDSYGIIPDDEKKKIDRYFMNLIGTTENYLTKLLWNARKDYDLIIEYNQIPFQKMSKTINTCGRWVATRLIMRDISMKDFQEFMKKMKKQYDRPYDEIVTLLTQPVLDDEMTSNEFSQILHEFYRESRIKTST